MPIRNLDFFKWTHVAESDRDTDRPTGRARRALCLYVLGPVLSAALLWFLAGMTVGGGIQAAERTDGVLTVVGSTGATLHEAPAGNMIQSLSPGTVLTAVGRTADNQWVVVLTSDGTSGWVEVDRVVLFGLDQLPVATGGGAVAPAAPQAATPVALPSPTNTPFPTPTPPPTPTPLPTSTPTPLPTPAATATQALDPGLRSNLVAVVRAGGADLLAQPGADVLQSLETGTAVTALARSGDSQWLLITTGAGANGWVDAGKVIIFNSSELPVIVGDTQAAAQPEVAATAVTPPEVSAPAATAPSSPSTEPADMRRPTPAPSAGQVTAIVDLDESRLNIRHGPATNYAIKDKARPGDVFVVSARNDAGTWVQIESADLSEGSGWVSAEYVRLSEAIENLPIIEVDDPPASPPMTVASSSPAAKPVAGLWGKLVFQDRPGGTIYVYDIVSGSLRPLTSGFDPAISPDGKHVAFTRGGGGNGIYVIDIDGGNERKIYSGNELLRTPSWSPDGQWIVFSRASGEYKCRDVGFGLCLPDNPFLKEFPLSTVPELGLSRVDTNGENFRDLSTLTSAQAPDWHENGIVYQSNSGIEITNDTPEGQTRVLAGAPYYQDPAWQPSGDRILFQSREGSHWEIFSINSDGGGQYALTRPVTTLVDELPSNVAPAFSPDGRWIVYLSSRDDQNGTGPWRIWVMREDGSEQQPLPIDIPLDYTFGIDQIVSWGP